MRDRPDAAPDAPRRKELVREADVDWGRDSGEHPKFESQGQAPHAEDPYTVESVRAELARLLAVPTSGA